MTNIVKTDFRTPKDEEWMRPALLFMYARDPYTRMWSAYLDKFVLPDFWAQGKRFIRELRPIATAESLKCGHDVTFQEFIRYSFSHMNSTEPGEILNEHFKPIYYNCNPCKHKFDLIGKAESFTNDTELVFASSGLFGTIPSDHETDQVMSEIQDLVQYNLNIRDKHYIFEIPKDCLTADLIARRLWSVFQYNGYIGKDIPFQEIPTESSSNDIVMLLVKNVRNVRKTADQATLDTWKKQRVNSMRNAYLTLPSSLLELFQKMYAVDFHLFQYEAHPNWLK